MQCFTIIPYSSGIVTCTTWMTTSQEDMGESRMDVIDSEIGYLGFHESESYGLVWKVTNNPFRCVACGQPVGGCASIAMLTAVQ